MPWHPSGGGSWRDVLGDLPGLLGKLARGISRSNQPPLLWPAAAQALAVVQKKSA